jgi:hypothetical protein
MVANALARRLRKAGFDAVAIHRDVRKTKKTGSKFNVQGSRSA